MNGEYPLMKFVELSDCTDASAEDDVARWLRERHLPDLEASGWVEMGGRIYRNVLSTPGSDEGRFLIIAPAVDRWDIDDLADVFSAEIEPQWQSQGRIDERFQRVWRDATRLCGPTMRPSRSPFVTERTGSAAVTAVLVQTSTCDLDNQIQLNEWYNRVRVPEMVQAGPFHTAYRYASAEWGAPRRLLQIFETDVTSPAAEIERFLSEWRPASPAPPFLEELGTSVFAPA